MAFSAIAEACEPITGAERALEAEDGIPHSKVRNLAQNLE
jgi:hypothetical protein